MFVILDTNHYREFLHESEAGHRLRQRLIDTAANAFITVVTVQEVTQGWTAEINRRTAGQEQVHAYRQFQNAIHDFADVTILPFDDEAADEFQQLRGLRLMVGTMDLKIAAIARSHASLLLTRNLVDFSKVPGLQVENWLD